MARRLRLGHISYSNCFPVHARLLDEPRPGDPALVVGVPSELNSLLEQGRIDVAPSSSIEYALHPERYRIIPDLVIGARGSVRSIVFLSTVSPEGLAGSTVAIPSASATSVVLLKILLKIRWKVEPNFRWFDQLEEDPFAAGAGAALFIGDVALRRELYPEHSHRFDLGQEWWDETGLPFAFAVWQATGGEENELHRLHQLLLESRSYAGARRRELAERYSRHFRMDPADLEKYWATLAYDLTPDMIDGLLRFYELAAEIGELERMPELRWVGAR